MTPNCFTMKGFPFFASGPIISGFGRGSKQLGIPTANYPDIVVDSLPPDIKTGVYFGWAQIDNGAVYKMVMSIGWNPFFKNVKKSMETHILHKFDSDLYGSNLKTCLLGYLREEKDFASIVVSSCAANILSPDAGSDDFLIHTIDIGFISSLYVAYWIFLLTHYLLLTSTHIISDLGKHTLFIQWTFKTSLHAHSCCSPTTS